MNGLIKAATFAATILAAAPAAAETLTIAAPSGSSWKVESTALCNAGSGTLRHKKHRIGFAVTDYGHLVVAGRDYGALCVSINRAESSVTRATLSASLGPARAIMPVDGSDRALKILPVLAPLKGAARAVINGNGKAAGRRLMQGGLTLQLQVNLQPLYAAMQGVSASADTGVLSTKGAPAVTTVTNWIVSDDGTATVTASR